ncbi:MAG TPA: flagellar basal body rod protein FlgC [Polyangiaceae bacterium]|nr:flagellar basal body rod protein FlgC [Polyangiaceae bacterium]
MQVGTFSAMELAASGLSAERVRMNTIASNLANAHTTRTGDGGPYKRIDPVFTAVPLRAGGITTPLGRAASLVRVTAVEKDKRDPMMVYEPGHPDADANGYVKYPNVNVVEEMVNMMTASRAYDAGVTAIDSIKGMAHSALGIGR